MSELKGDFIGFQFDGVHSSELGIVRTSEGNRYNENLFPSIQDKTTQIPGADGTFFFGTYFTQRQMSFSIAYDHLTDDQIKRIKTLFGDKKIHDLIFDELPYKVFKVKSIGTPNLKYICFNEPPSLFADDIHTKDELYNPAIPVSGLRIYKGEGQLSFITYVPYANSRYKFIDEYTLDTVPSWGSMNNSYAEDAYYNLYDWEDSSRLIRSDTTKTVTSGGTEVTYTIDDYNFEVEENNTTKYLSPGNILVYNAGDIDTSFKLYIYFESGQFPGCVLGASNSDYFGKMTVANFNLFTGDNGICINSKLNLIEGVKYTFDNNDNVTSIESTGTIYNKYITDGDFFKIKPTEEPVLMPMVITDFSTATTSKWLGSIDYKYYYF
ncbi:MAG: hypothetical protein IKU01_01630 [Bacteroidales bacterium]|nr:hypothetical protein [Bacteroidales bacterium]